MKAEEIVLPELAKYYISKRVLNDIKNALLYAHIRFVEDKNQIHFTCSCDIETMRGLMLISKKAEKTTIGNKYVYEYELDMNIQNGCIFIIKIDGIEYRCRLIHVGGGDKENSLHTIFHIVKK